MQLCRRVATVFAFALVRVSILDAQPGSSIPRIVGLLDMPAIYSEGVRSPEKLEVHELPSETSNIVAALDGNGIQKRPGDTYGCKWQRDLDAQAEGQRVVQPGGCIFTESGYEIAAIAVLDRRREWSKIRLANDQASFGWVRTANDRFHSLAELVAGQDRATYLTSNWDRRVYRKAGGGGFTTVAANQANNGNDLRYAYRALSSQVVGGVLWVRVEILRVDPCEDPDTTVLESGWVPSLGPSGKIVTWFSSRGC